MPRDTNGNYTLPSGNPVATATIITSTWANDTMSDLGNEMQDSLSRSGKGGFTAPVGIVDKSGSVPGLSFVNEPTSGLKREAAGDVRVQVQGQDNIRWLGAGRATEIWNPAATVPAFERAFTTPVADAIDAAVKFLQVKRLTTGGAVPASLGEGELAVNVEDNPPKIFVGSTGGTSVRRVEEFPSGTKIPMYQDAAPPEWTIDPSIDEHSVRLTKGSVALGVAGGTSGGTYDFSVLFADLAENATPGIGSHVITVGEIPSHRHGLNYYLSTAFGPFCGQGGTTNQGNAANDTADAGGGGGHSHTVDLRAKWAAFIVAVKD